MKKKNSRFQPKDKRTEKGPPPLGGKGGEGGEGRGEGNVCWAALSPPFPSLPSCPHRGAQPPPRLTHPPVAPGPVVREGRSRFAGPPSRTPDPPLPSPCCRPRSPFPLFFLFLMKGEKRKSFFLEKNSPFKKKSKKSKKVVATLLLEF
jgi:hypothetical protein